MSELESVVLVCAWLAGGFLWLRWYMIFGMNQMYEVRNYPARQLMPYVPFVCVALLFFVLIRFAASDVRSDGGYVFLYLGIGVVWVGLVEWVSGYLGISAFRDVLERGNWAAFFALSGALIGATLCYSGGNIGEGPGMEVVFFSSGLATLAFFALWWTFVLVTEADQAITIDRDLAAGLRLGGLLAAAGLILGRSVAGDWVSVGATVADFFQYVPALLVLLVVAIFVERMARPTVDRPIHSATWYGFLPLLIYVGGAVLYLVAAQAAIPA